MKALIILYLATITLLLGACDASKNIDRPYNIAPATYRTFTTPDTTATLADIPWKSFFNDAELQRLIDSSVANNYDMQTAVKNIEAAQLLVRQSRLGNMPEANLQATSAVSRPSDNSLNGLSLSKFVGKSYVEDYALTALLGWEADIWGRIKNQQSKALASYLLTAEARKAVQTNLVADVAWGYYNLLMLDAQVAIAKKNLLLNDSTLNIIKLQYNAGEVSALGVQQAQAQSMVAAQLIPQLEEGIAPQENALGVLAGIAPSAIRRSHNINDVNPSSKLSVGVPSSLLQNRPDVKAKELELIIANANTRIAKANMYPSITITAAGGINSFKASNWFTLPASLFTSAAGSLSQPLFQRKQLRTQYNLSKVATENAVIQFRQSVLNAVGEVSDALVQRDKLKEQQLVAAERVTILEQATATANLLFKNGMANYLEVITAQSRVLQAELELAVLKKDELIASVALYRSLGGGWK